MMTIGANLVCRLQECSASPGQICYDDPTLAFELAVNEATYLRLVSKVRSLRRTWTQYEIVVHNCNSFVGEIASSVGLRTPLITAQYPVGYVTEASYIQCSANFPEVTKRVFYDGARAPTCCAWVSCADRATRLLSTEI